MVKISKAEQYRITQRALLDTARELFAERGYAKTSIEEVVRRANVTRGALYYHYRDKAALFQAVYEEVRTGWVQSVMEKMQAAKDAGASLWKQMIVGCRAFVEAASAPGEQRILYIDGPAVLDWHVVQRDSPGLRFLQHVGAQLIDEGVIEEIPLDPLAHTLWVTFFGAGMYIANAEDSATAQEEIVDVLIRLISGLRPHTLAASVD